MESFQYPQLNMMKPVQWGPCCHTAKPWTAYLRPSRLLHCTPAPMAAPFSYALEKVCIASEAASAGLQVVSPGASGQLWRKRQGKYQAISDSIVWGGLCLPPSSNKGKELRFWEAVISHKRGKYLPHCISSNDQATQLSP